VFLLPQSNGKLTFSGNDEYGFSLLASGRNTSFQLDCFDGVNAEDDDDDVDASSNGVYTQRSLRKYGFLLSSNDTDLVCVADGPCPPNSHQFPVASGQVPGPIRLGGKLILCFDGSFNS